jgi:hypothetical protein
MIAQDGHARAAPRSPRLVDSRPGPGGRRALVPRAGWMARIDRLPAEEKQLLQAASVIGKDVPYALLAAIAEQPEEGLRRGLGHLQEAEFLYEARLFPDLELTFKHALTHDVTYGGLLQERRRALHARVVDVTERRHADRLAEHVERLGHHAFQAQVWDKAWRYLRQTGLKAYERSSSREALASLEHALEALGKLPETRETLEAAIDLSIDLRSARVAVGDIAGSLRAVRAGEELAVRLGDQPRIAWLSAYGANILNMLGDYGLGRQGTRRPQLRQWRLPPWPSATG